MYCSKCGSSSDGKFCPACGSPMGTQPESGARAKPEPGSQTQWAGYHAPRADGRDILEQVKREKKKFDRFVGADESVHIKVSDLFSGILKKHTKEEQDEILICGTSKTTPPESEISAGWTPPWVFSRVFLVLFATFIALYICVASFGNILSCAGMIFIGSLAVPFSLMLFFWEANIPRNMSFFDILVIFFIGGALSLILTLIISEVAGGSGELNYWGAIVVGVVEEIAKFLVCLIFIKRNNTKYILNGLLIGAAIGAGFAVFESAGYAFVYLVQSSIDTGVDVIFLRGFLAGGGHIVWAAITSAAFVLVKQDRPFSFEYLRDKRFVILFLIPVALHSIWDMPIHFLDGIYFMPLLLTAYRWRCIRYGICRYIS